MSSFQGQAAHNAAYSEDQNSTLLRIARNYLQGDKSWFPRRLERPGSE